jgi:hypothetical protein
MVAWNVVLLVEMMVVLKVVSMAAMKVSWVVMLKAAMMGSKFHFFF